MITKEFITRLPKNDLHLHLDGSMRLGTLIELGEQYGVELPATTEEGLKQTVFKERYDSLADYLRGFKYTGKVLQSELALSRVSYELAEDCQAEGCRYIEVRFAPQLHMHRHLSCENVLKAVNEGLRKAQAEFNLRPEIRDGKEPPFEYGIIVCAMRMFLPSFSEYYSDLWRVHSHSEPEMLYAMASLELARAVVRVRDEAGIPIVGFDLAGEEAGFPAGVHKEAFAYCHKHFMKKTVHAGEAYGPESIFQAVTELYADRLGHAYYLYDQDTVKDPEITDREAYTRALVEFIADRRVTLEICLTSNLQTIPKLRDLKEHNFAKMMKDRQSTTFCTDNRTVSNTTVTSEILKAVEHLGLGVRDLRNSVIYGFKRSFFPHSYSRKRAYVRQIIDYYDQVEAEFGIERKNS
ncbi:MAG: adenosine deaminase family protein [Polyangia bacterium]|nr:adenosine deaminase family protein [Polyangia bacterium]